MANTMTEKERVLIPELIQVVNKLGEKDLEHLLWIGQGILFASDSKNGKAS